MKRLILGFIIIMALVSSGCAGFKDFMQTEEDELDDAGQSAVTIIE